MALRDNLGHERDKSIVERDQQVPQQDKLSTERDKPQFGTHFSMVTKTLEVI